jgi:hypothetical protein
LSANTKHRVIGRPAIREKVANGLRLYLQKAQADSSLVLSILAIARATGLKKSTIYRYQADPEVARLLTTIRNLDEARKAARLKLDVSPNSQVKRLGDSRQQIGKLDDASRIREVPDEVIAERAAASVQKAIWAMSRFTGRHRRHRHVSDLPRVVFDLDVTASELYSVLSDLKPLSEEWTRRDREYRGAEQQQPRLFLNQVIEEQSGQ